MMISTLTSAEKGFAAAKNGTICHQVKRRVYYSVHNSIATRETRVKETKPQLRDISINHHKNAHTVRRDFRI